MFNYSIELVWIDYITIVWYNLLSELNHIILMDDSWNHQVPRFAFFPAMDS